VKKFIMGLVIGLLLATAIGATASSNIRLIVDGKEIQTDVPPQLINGRVMVPVRFVGEALGSKVEWDDSTKTVIIRSCKTAQETITSTEIEPQEVIIYINDKILTAEYQRWENSHKIIKKDNDIYLQYTPLNEAIWRLYGLSITHQIWESKYITHNYRTYISLGYAEQKWRIGYRMESNSLFLFKID